MESWHLNVKRIIVFGFILLVINFSLGLVYGFCFGTANPAFELKLSMPLFLLTLVVPIAADSLVFFFFAKDEREQNFASVFGLLVMYALLDSPVEVLWFKIPIGQWLYR